MKIFTQEQLSEILDKHKLWLNGDEDGERANLSSDNLSSDNLSSANLSSANLSSANLSSANLSSANLSSANLSSDNLSSDNLSSDNLRFISSADGSVLACINAGKYQVVAASDRVAIGCQMHSVEDWFNFDDDKISRMDDGALEWWKQWKELVFAFHKNIFGETK